MRGSHKKRRQREGMPTNSEDSEKSQNENNFCNGQRGDNLAGVDGVCSGAEDGNRDWVQTRKSFECQVCVFSLHHKGNREVLKVHEQET